MAARSAIGRSVREHGMADPGRVFRERALDFRSLCAINAAFLRGRLAATPYHAGPIAGETRRLLPALLRLHRLGFLSVTGQPPKPGTQRSYISGFMPRARYAAFVAFVSAPRFRARAYVSAHRRPGVVGFTTFPSARVTVTRAGRRPITCVRPEDVIGLDDFEGFPRVLGILTRECCFVTLVGARFGSGAVEDVLLAFLG